MLRDAWWLGKPCYRVARGIEALAAECHAVVECERTELLRRLEADLRAARPAGA